MKTIQKNKIRMLFCLALMSVTFFSSVHAMPPDPSNAGLLYYQAFLMQRRTDKDTLEMVNKLAKGEIEPNETVVEYLNNNKAAIKFAAAAADMPICDWGLKYSDGFALEIPYLSQTRNLAYILIAQARVKASIKDYDTAVEHCLTAQKMADHTSQSLLISYLVGYSIKDLSYNCLLEMISQTQLDLKLLEKLKTQLDVIEGKNVSFRVALEFEKTSIAEIVSEMDTLELIQIIEELVEKKDPNTAIAIERIKSADQDFYDRNINYFNRYFAEYIASIDLPYTQAYEKIVELDNKPKEAFKNNSDATFTQILSPTLVKAYNYEAKRRSFSNALRAAVSIYIIAAKTGQLPDELPEGLPKDIYSDQNFNYQITDQGFILKCNSENLYEEKIYEYEFKITK